MCQSPEALAQLLERALVKAYPKMSDLERDELKIPGPCHLFSLIHMPTVACDTWPLLIHLLVHLRFSSAVSSA
jgi:hypothetical protein